MINNNSPVGEFLFYSNSATIMLMNELFIILALALLGVCFGSFVNAAVWRIKKKKNLWSDRSQCVHCHPNLYKRVLLADGLFAVATLTF